MTEVYGYRAEVVLYDDKGRRLHIDCIEMDPRTCGFGIRSSVLDHAIGCAHAVTDWDDRVVVSSWRVEAGA